MVMQRIGSELLMQYLKILVKMSTLEKLDDNIKEMKRKKTFQGEEPFLKEIFPDWINDEKPHTNTDQHKQTHRESDVYNRKREE